MPYRKTVRRNNTVDNRSSKSPTDPITRRSLRKPPATKAHRSSTSPTSSSVPHWKTLCQEILTRLLDCSASALFQKPVNRKESPGYTKIVKTPIDFGTIKRRLQAGKYSQPQAFLSDICLLFLNSRCYYRNPDSAVYRVTTQLLDTFDSLMQEFSEKLEASKIFVDSKSPIIIDDDSEEDSVIFTTRKSPRTNIQVNYKEDNISVKGNDSGEGSKTKASNCANRNSRRRELGNTKTHRTRLVTGAIRYSNVRKAEDVLDLALYEDELYQRKSYFKRQEERRIQYHYRRLRNESYWLRPPSEF